MTVTNCELLFTAAPLTQQQPMMTRSPTPAPPPPASQMTASIEEVKEAPTRIHGTRNETKVPFDNLVFWYIFTITKFMNLKLKNERHWFHFEFSCFCLG